MIIEWNGCSLVDATFEETQAIIERSGNVIQLLVQEESNIGRKGSKSILKMARSDLTRSASAKRYRAIDSPSYIFNALLPGEQSELLISKIV